MEKGYKWSISEQVNGYAGLLKPPLVFFVIAGEAALIGAFLFLVYKIYQDRHRVGMPALRALLAVVVCFNIWILVVIPQQMGGPQRVIAAICAQYGAFFYYVAVKRMFKDERPQFLLRDKGFWVTALVVVILISLDLSLGTSVTFDNNNPKIAYTSNLISNTEVVFSHIYILFLDILIIKIYLTALLRNDYISDQGRLGLCLLAFILNTLGLLLVGFNLLLYIILKNNDTRMFLNHIYYISLVVMVFLGLLSYILPDLFFVKVLYPLTLYKNVRQRRQQALLRSLHQTMVKIVPGVQLSVASVESVHDLRILIEISDARQIIWSLQQRLQPITPQEEATYLVYLMRKKVVVQAPGEHTAPPTSLNNIVKHNVLVAEQLERLQKAV